MKPVPISVPAAPLTPGSLELQLTEGRYHQIHRMAGALGRRVLALHRTTIGPLTLGTLQPGDWRSLTDEELRQLRIAVGL